MTTDEDRFSGEIGSRFFNVSLFKEKSFEAMPIQQEWLIKKQCNDGFINEWENHYEVQHNKSNFNIRLQLILLSLWLYEMVENHRSFFFSIDRFGIRPRGLFFLFEGCQNFFPYRIPSLRSGDSSVIQTILISMIFFFSFWA